MDRTTVNVAKSQIGFLDVIIIPAFQAASQVIEVQSNLTNIDINKAKWQERFDEYEERMNNDKERINSKKAVTMQ
jgi:predicted ATP-grasp superfamily ATP-dependent carboligase